MDDETKPVEEVQNGMLELLGGSAAGE